MSTTLKSCKEIYLARVQAWHEVYDRYNAEIKLAREREFPVGTRVKFQHGTREVQAVVTELCHWSEDKVKLKNVKTGTTWEKEVHHLERVAT